MNKAKIYLDTSVINFLFADDAPDFQKATVEFFQTYAGFYELHVSDVVILEIDRTTDRESRDMLYSILRQHPIEVLSDSRYDEVSRLADRYIERGAIPRTKVEDAQHVAYATVYEMDILLSWNFRHLANISRETRVLAVNLEEGYRHPLRLLSPLEVLHE